MMGRRDGYRRGQAILEYLLVGVVIIIALLFIGNAFIKPAVEKSAQDSAGMIERSSTKIGELVP